jgi:hypothetical protein
MKIAEDRDLSARLGGNLFHVLVHTSGPADRSEEWRKFTQWVRELLNSATNCAPIQ